MMDPYRGVQIEATKAGTFRAEFDSMGLTHKVLHKLLEDTHDEIDAIKNLENGRRPVAAFYFGRAKLKFEPVKFIGFDIGHSTMLVEVKGGKRIDRVGTKWGVVTLLKPNCRTKKMASAINAVREARSWLDVVEAELEAREAAGFEAGGVAQEPVVVVE